MAGLMWYIKFAHRYYSVENNVFGVVALNANKTKIRLSELQVLYHKMISKSNSHKHHSHDHSHDHHKQLYHLYIFIVTHS